MAAHDAPISGADPADWLSAFLSWPASIQLAALCVVESAKDLPDGQLEDLSGVFGGAEDAPNLAGEARHFLGQCHTLLAAVLADRALSRLHGHLHDLQASRTPAGYVELLKQAADAPKRGRTPGLRSGRPGGVSDEPHTRSKSDQPATASTSRRIADSGTLT